MQQQAGQPAHAAAGIEDALLPVHDQIREPGGVAELRLFNVVYAHPFWWPGGIIAVTVIQETAGQELAVEFELGIVGGFAPDFGLAEALPEGRPVAGQCHATDDAFHCKDSGDFVHGFGFGRRSRLLGMVIRSAPEGTTG
ncbi:MAG: hypothetical protein QM813_22335 [Verrucomicrobiota bacterium]